MTRGELLARLGAVVGVLALIGATTVAGPINFADTFTVSSASPPVVDIASAGVTKAMGGTAASTGRGAANNLSLAYVLCQSGVAVSHTGNTSETPLATCTVPAGAPGANGRLRIGATLSGTSSANTKTYRVRYSGAAGTAYAVGGVTTNPYVRYLFDIANRNATNSQVGGAPHVLGTAAAAGATTSAVDTTAETTIVITGQLTDSGETVTLEDYSVTLMSSAGN